MVQPYRLGLDIGTNSIGWCALKLDKAGDPVGILDIGVRIFSDSRDPQSGTSLATERRGPRQQRRRRDRYLDRREGFMAALVRHGLMPADPAERKKLEALDPYELRGRGLDEALTPFQLGRALFHLNQRRGFKSNRKAERKAGEDSKGLKAGIGKLHEAMREAGARTLGEYLWRNFRKDRPVRQREAVRARPRRVGAKNEYDMYAARDMYEAEFDALWAAQAPHRTDVLTDRARDDLRRILFFQRDLKPVAVGKCRLVPEDERAPDALPLAQRFRMLQELANLEWRTADLVRHRLTPAQRDNILKKLERSKKLSFDKIRGILGLDAGVPFNLEDAKRTDLNGDRTGAVLAHKARFGKAWWDFPLDRRTAIVERLLAEENEQALVDWLVAGCGVDEDTARAIAGASLPAGHSSLGRIALGKIVPAMETATDPAMPAAVIRYAQAAAAAGYHHSDHRTGEVFAQLPYYGQVLERQTAFGTGKPEDSDEKRYGRVSNPTVHVGLNQLRRVINAVAAVHGAPHSIVVETARELKLTWEQRKDIEREQAANQGKNDARRKELAELGQRDTYDNRMRLRLWEEQGPPQARVCPFTGKPISKTMLFSPEVEIEHLLPFSKSLDDGAANKVVSLRSANRDKGNRSPYEAFGTSPKPYDWNAIALRAGDLPPNKRWRFAPDAMDRLKREGDFLARHLTDTGYLARMARTYLGHVCGPNNVSVVPGRLTALLRGKWGLNQLLSDANLKNRTDHRHHAIDAAVVCVTDRGLLRKVATASEASRERLIDTMPEPWDGFRDEVAERVRAILVSHKADHGSIGRDPKTGASRTTGRLHNDTAYGIVEGPDRAGYYAVVHRVPLTALETPDDVAAVRDPVLRGMIAKAVEGLDGKEKKKERTAALEAFARDNNVRSVRIVERMANVIRLTDRAGKPYKAFKGDSNHCMEVWRLPDGVWRGRIVSTFEANRPDGAGGRDRPHPAARRLMRLFNDDLVRMIDPKGGTEEFMRVVKMSGQTVYLAPHNEGGSLKARDADKDDPFKYRAVSVAKMKDAKARKISVDPMGRVRYPGPYR